MDVNPSQGRDVTGERYRVMCVFKCLVCGLEFGEGVEVEIVNQTSPNRLMITVVNSGSLHKVKRSTFNRCTERIEARRDG